MSDAHRMAQIQDTAEWLGKTGAYTTDEGLLGIVADLRTENAAAAARLREQEAEIGRLTARVVELKREWTDMIDLYTKCHASEMAAHDRIATLTTERDALQGFCKAAGEKIATLTSELETARESLRELAYGGNFSKQSSAPKVPFDITEEIRARILFARAALGEKS